MKNKQTKMSRTGLPSVPSSQRNRESESSQAQASLSTPSHNPLHCCVDYTISSSRSCSNLPATALNIQLAIKAVTLPFLHASMRHVCFPNSRPPLPTPACATLIRHNLVFLDQLILIHSPFCCVPNRVPLATLCCCQRCRVKGTLNLLLDSLVTDRI